MVAACSLFGAMEGSDVSGEEVLHDLLADENESGDIDGGSDGSENTNARFKSHFNFREKRDQPCSIPSQAKRN